MAAVVTRPTVGRWVLGARIAAGGMGEVFEAHDAHTGSPAAVKLLRPDAAPAARARFMAETRLTARVRHPSVIEVLDHGTTDDGQPYLAMERLSGRTLRDRLAEGPLDDEEVRSLGVQLIDALAAAHRVGVVHRDVKPGNILDAGGGRWKLADFGIATWSVDASSTVTGDLLGSPAYLPPERLAGDRATRSSDLYAVAVVLYEALCGATPFPGRDPWEVIERIRTGDVPHPLDVRPDADQTLAAAIVRGMRRRPADRFVSAAAFGEALRSRVVDDEETIPLLFAPSPDETQVLDELSGPPAPTGAGERSGIGMLAAAFAALVAALLVMTIAVGDRAPVPGAPAVLDRGLPVEERRDEKPASPGADDPTARGSEGSAPHGGKEKGNDDSGPPAHANDNGKGKARGKAKGG
ncbi:MAG TPA: serine/threonine-protein kinase [Actinomycetota bacterium]